jgi:hypothetical protein
LDSVLATPECEKDLQAIFQFHVCGPVASVWKAMLGQLGSEVMVKTALLPAGLLIFMSGTPLILTGASSGVASDGSGKIVHQSRAHAFLESTN